MANNNPAPSTIPTGPDRNTVDDPLKSVDRNQYTYSNFIYPLDLGAEGSGKDHYVVFHINETSTTQYKSVTVNGAKPTDQPTIERNRATDQRKGFGGGVAPTDAPTPQGGEKTNANQGNPVFETSIQALKQPINRIATTIILPMPREIQTTYQAEWQAENLGAAADFLNTVKGRESIGEAFKSAGIGALPTIGSMSNQFTNLNITGALSLGTRMAINPHQEVIFNGIGFRPFTFNFRFTPESEDEAINVDNIIRAFKFYAAPEILKGTAGRFWIYPAEFDISFYSNGVENDFLHKISTCALVDIQVNYTPVGHWSAFRPANPKSQLGGSPSVCTDLTLTFKELEIMTKQRVLEGYAFVPIWWFLPVLHPVINTIHTMINWAVQTLNYKPMPVYIETWFIIAILSLMGLTAKNMLDLLLTQNSAGENIKEVQLKGPGMLSMKQFGNMVLKILRLK